jgi:hypothetical protein
VLAYYEAARAEILERLNVRANIAVLYIAAIGAVAGYTLGDPSERFYLFVIIIPFLAMGAATLWFQQNLAMDTISYYCANQLCPYIEELWKEKGGAGKPPPSIDQLLFPQRKRSRLVERLFKEISDIAILLFIIPQILAPIGIGIALWRKMWEGGGGRLTNLLPEWAIPLVLVVVWLGLFALTLSEIQQGKGGTPDRTEV